MKISERIAAVVAAEIMELTAEQRVNFKFPDDANGDTIERANSAMLRIMRALRDPPDKMLLAPGEPYGGKVEQSNGLRMRRHAWNMMIDTVLAEVAA